jgi:DNA-binding SARP family transcriptional activator
LNFRSVKVRGLLAYLSVETKKSLTRECLADLFWPDYPELKARSNLRNAVWNLRRELGEFQPGIHYIVSEKSKILFNPKAEFWLDFNIFNDLIDNVSNNSEPSINVEVVRRMEQALDLYRGSFIEDVFIDSPGFETWIDNNHLQIHQKRIQALRYISKAYYRADELLKSLSWVKNWIELDPWAGEPCRLSMRILTKLGRRNEAISQFRKYQNRLLEDLGVKPQLETNILFEEIQNDSESLTFLPTAEMTAESQIDRVETKLPPEFLIKSIQEKAESTTFFARQNELKQLNGWLLDSLKGKGRVGMIVGEPGSGKTYLMNEFVRQSLENYPNLLIFQGQCNAHFGYGDLYYPFLNIVRMLANDLESLAPSAFVNLEHLERLWHYRSEMLCCLVEHGPDLIQRFLLDNHLIASLREQSGLKPECKQILYSPTKKVQYKHKEQIPVNDQLTQVLICLAKKQPILIIIDDLQWIDDGSASLLFHLGRQISGKPIFLLGAFRPEEVFQNPARRKHPLKNIYQDYQTIFSKITIDLNKSDGEGFIEKLLSSEPNALSELFHKKLYQLTSGNPLFTIELLRGMQSRNEIYRDQYGKWMEGDHLNWKELPTRVEAAIGRRVSILPKDCLSLLSLASVQGDIFNTDVVALVISKPENEVFELLNENICKQHQLITLYGIHVMGERYITSFRFRHLLFQIYLYNQLNDAEKIRLHKKVGMAIEKLYEDHIDQYPEIALSLVRHYELAGLKGKAGKYYTFYGMETEE